MSYPAAQTSQTGAQTAQSQTQPSFQCPTCRQPMILLARLKPTCRSHPLPQPDHVIDFQPT